MVTWAGASVAITANDAPGLTGLRVATPPSHGTASIVNGALRFDPVSGYIGRDSLLYAATLNGQADSAMVRLDVLPGPYVATDVGPASAFHVNSMNDAGQVAGTVMLADGTARAFRWTAGRIELSRALEDAGCGNSEARPRRQAIIQERTLQGPASRDWCPFAHPASSSPRTA